MSHPAWVCGLKPLWICVEIAICNVTPCVGVWIETLYTILQQHGDCVTPCVGVWIETPCLVMMVR